MKGGICGHTGSANVSRVPRNVWVDQNDIHGKLPTMAKEEKRSSKMFWIDMEMTGLDEKKCKILEVAVVITDLNLNKLEEYSTVVYQPKEVLDTMDAWCKDTHGKSGLTAEVPKGKKLPEMEKDLIALSKKHFPEEKIVLSGNSVFQDRKFIDAYLPQFEKLLHYRLIDVSSFKEVFKNKFNLKFEKKDTHRAKSDIYESIGELRYYLTFVRGEPSK
jgi:oligoribonuclease